MDITLDDDSEFYLPEEMWIEIVSFLDMKCVFLTLNLVSKQFSEIVTRSYCILNYYFEKVGPGFILQITEKKLYIKDASGLSVEAVDALFGDCRFLQDLVLKKLRFQSYIIVHNETSPLRRLSLQNCEFHSLGIQDGMVLRDLDLSNCENLELSGVFFQSLQDTLERLTLKCITSLSDDDIVVFSKFWKKLQFLDLTHHDRSHGITCASLKSIAGNCALLDTLLLNHCSRIKNKGIEYLEKLPNLRKLELADCKRLTGGILNSLNRMKYLQYLDLGQCKGIFTMQTESWREDVVVDKVVSCKLREFSASFLGLSEKNCVKLAQSIRSLNLSWNGTVNDHTMKYIAQTTNKLEELDVSSCRNITNFGLMDLAKYWKSRVTLKKLTIINHSSRLNGKGIKAIKAKFGDDCTIITNKKKERERS